MAWTYNVTVKNLKEPCSIRHLLQHEWWLSRKVVHFLRTEERVLVNGSYHSINSLVKNGDHVELTFLPDDFQTPIPPFDSDPRETPEVLYENDDLLVVNKSAGIKTHANQPHELGSMMNFLQAYLAPDNYAYNVHRLDQQTSGALLVAKNPVIVPILSRQISQKAIQRTYLCVVEGQLDDPVGTINIPIGLDPNDQRKRRVNGEQAQNAVTHYQTLYSAENKSVLAIQLETGRTHQIRVHLASLGHPIIGDPLYNSKSTEKMLLHSWKVAFPIPFDNDIKEITAPIPEYFPTQKELL